MRQTTLFIADLHLNDSQPEIYQRFKSFIHDKAQDADSLYILGDLFEYYLGDDAITDVAQKVCDDLNNLTSKYQTKCYFMAGNRDFLLSSAFASAAGLIILEYPSIIVLDDEKLILTHGDELCTDDIEYQKIRQQLRSKKWQQWFLSLSLQERIAFANQARIKSQQHTQASKAEIMDVNQLAVVNLFKQHKTTLMLHGHTHRPAFHNFLIDNKQHHRMVVGDWHQQTSYIEHKNSNFQLSTY
ncbi:MAG: UDP-2,3-diacylglucosamine diphosphatase [Alcanivoracaceae bacterium]|nr:UDP-2,3-diacylglucosamine diphosphatase [Alcanivoracaceae bacterium]